MQHFHTSPLRRIADERRASLFDSELELDLDERLQLIKALLIAKKYRQCIQVCESTLTETDEDDIVLYLRIYMGLAHDDLAREMHNLSRFKSSRFKLAEQHYEEALRIISELEYQRPASYNLPREMSSMSLLSAFSGWSDKPARQSKANEHIKKLKEQIMTHLRLTEEAKKRSEEMLARRQRLHSLNSPFKTAPSPGLQSSKSYWSFTPEMTKASEKQLRIEDGRARNWAKERFQPERYRRLAEDALAEL